MIQSDVELVRALAKFAAAVEDENALPGCVDREFSRRGKRRRKGAGNIRRHHKRLARGPGPELDSGERNRKSVLIRHSPGYAHLGRRDYREASDEDRDP